MANELFSFCYAMTQKNIIFLRRPSKKADFIIENIFEEVNIIDDKKIIELYFERNQQAIKKTDIEYGKLCHKIAYNVLNNRQDSEECVNATYLGVWNRIPPARPGNFKSYISTIVRNTSIDKFRKLKAQKRSANMVMALDELADVLPDERYAPGRNDEEIGKSISIFLYKQKEEIRRVFLLKYFYFESNIAIAERCGFTERKALMFLHSLLVWLQVTICIQTILQDVYKRQPWQIMKKAFFLDYYEIQRENCEIYRPMLERSMHRELFLWAEEKLFTEDTEYYVRFLQVILLKESTMLWMEEEEARQIAEAVLPLMESGFQKEQLHKKYMTAEELQNYEKQKNWKSEQKKRMERWKKEKELKKSFNHIVRKNTDTDQIFKALYSYYAYGRFDGISMRAKMVLGYMRDVLKRKGKIVTDKQEIEYLMELIQKLYADGQLELDGVRKIFDRMEAA